MIKNNEVLGYLDCADCDERATVHKAKRGKARHFYKRCGCGCDQRTGKAVQAKLYENTEWIVDKPEPPPGYQPKVVEAVDQPEKTTETQPKPEPDEQPNKPLVVGAVALLGAVLLAAIGIKS